MFFFLWFLFSLGKCEDDLPFEDDVEELPKVDQAGNEEIEKSNKFQETDHKRQKRTIMEIIGWREYIFMGVAIIYLSIFISGKRKIKSGLNSLRNTFNASLKDNFAFLGDYKRKSNHIYEMYITGRTSYIGALISVHFKKSLDIFGILIDKFSKAKNQLIVEMILDAKDLHAFLNITKLTSKDRQKILQKYQNTRAIDLDSEDYTFHADVDKLAEPFAEKFNEFNAIKPNLLKMAEFSDMNKFELRECGDVVARFEFEFEDFSQIDKTVGDFIVEMTDSFILLQRQTKVMETNGETRRVIRKAVQDVLHDKR